MFDRSVLPCGQLISKYLDEMERIHRELRKYPSSDEVTWLTLEAHRDIAAAPDSEIGIRALFGDIFSWARFALSSTIYRTLNLLEGGIHAFNTRNYLSWVLLSRGLLEIAAIYHYYVKRVETLPLAGPQFSATALQQAENLFMSYVRGTRYDWDAMRRGVLGETHDSDQLPKEPSAVRVGRALKDLGRSDPRFRNVKGVYGLLSDFAHPNMGSHMTVMNVQTEKNSGHHQCVLSQTADAHRGEFVMVATLPVTTLALQKIGEMSRPIGHLVSRWLDLMDGKIVIDFAS